MIKGQQRVYTHEPTGRQFIDYDTYLIAMKAWDKKYGLYSNGYARLLLDERIEREKKEKEAKKQRLKDLIKPLEDAQDQHIIRRNAHISLKNKEISNKISEYMTDIDRLQTAVQLLKGSLASYRKEAFTEYEKNHPFEGKKELKNLRAKLGKLY